MTQITQEQALAAQALINEATTLSPLIALIPVIPQEMKQLLQAAHEQSDCAARSEGM